MPKNILFPDPIKINGIPVPDLISQADKGALNAQIILFLHYLEKRNEKEYQEALIKYLKAILVNPNYNAKFFFDIITKKQLQVIFYHLNKEIKYKVLNLSPEKISCCICDFIFKVLTNPTFISVNLCFERLGEDDVNALAKVLETDNKITSIDLSYSNIGYNIQELADALTTNKTLTSINLRENKLKDYGVRKLAEMLKINRTLVSMNLSSNDIGVGGLLAVAEALTINKTLTLLDLGYIRFDFEVKKESDEQRKTKMEAKKCIKVIKTLAESLKTNITLTSIGELSTPFLSTFSTFFITLSEKRQAIVIEEFNKEMSVLIKEMSIILAQIKNYLKRNMQIAEAIQEILNTFTQNDLNADTAQLIHSKISEKLVIIHSLLPDSKKLLESHPFYYDLHFIESVNKKIIAPLTFEEFDLIAIMKELVNLGNYPKVNPSLYERLLEQIFHYFLNVATVSGNTDMSTSIHLGAILIVGLMKDDSKREFYLRMKAGILLNIGVLKVPFAELMHNHPEQFYEYFIKPMIEMCNEIGISLPKVFNTLYAECFQIDDKQLSEKPKSALKNILEDLKKMVYEEKGGHAKILFEATKLLISNFNATMDILKDTSKTNEEKLDSAAKFISTAETYQDSNTQLSLTAKIFKWTIKEVPIAASPEDTLGTQLMGWLSEGIYHLVYTPQQKLINTLSFELTQQVTLAASTLIENNKDKQKIIAPTETAQSTSFPSKAENARTDSTLRNQNFTQSLEKERWEDAQEKFGSKKETISKPNVNYCHIKEKPGFAPSPLPQEELRVA